MKPIDYNEMQKLLTTMHEELEKEYAEKMNRTRLENIYTEKYSSSSAAVFYTAFNRNSYRRLLYSSNEKFKTES